MIEYGSRARARNANRKGAENPETCLDGFGIDAAAALVHDERVRDFKCPEAWDKRYFA